VGRFSHERRRWVVGAWLLVLVIVGGASGSGSGYSTEFSLPDVESARGFDILEEDYEKERFFAFVRRSYWDSPENSPSRELTRALIAKLDF